MSVRFASRATLLTGLILLMSFAASAADNNATDPAGWAPQNALAYVGIPDLDELINGYKRTSAYRLMNDPVARDVIAELDVVAKLMDQLKSRLAKALDVESEKLKNPFGGAAALYLEASRESSTSEPEVVLILGVRDTELMRDYYQRAGRRFREMADQYEAVPFGSAEIDYYRHTGAADASDQELEKDLSESEMDSSQDADELPEFLDQMLGSYFSGESMPERLALCLARDRLIIAGSPDAVKDVLRRESGSGSLLQHADHQRLLREFEPIGQVRILVNLPSIFETIVKRDGDEAKRVINMLGFDGLRSVIAHLRFEGRDYESRADALAITSGERTGLVKILAMENRDVAPPKEAAADSLFYFSANLDPSAITDEWMRMVAKYDSAMAEQMRAELESVPMPDGTTMNIRKDVLANLRGPLNFIMQITRPYAPDAVRFLTTIGHRDKAAMTKLIGLMNGVMPMTDREVRGAAVYDAPYGGMSLSLTSDTLLLGATSAVEAALAGESGGGLGADSAFQRVAAMSPKQAWATIYVDSRRIFEAMLELARNRDAIAASAITNPAPAMALQMLGSLSSQVKEDKIEAATKLLAYQNVSLISFTTTPDGIRMSMVEAAPSGR